MEQNNKFKKGDLIECLDSTGNWFLSTVVNTDDSGRLFIHYQGWSNKYDEFIDPDANCNRIANVGTYTDGKPHASKNIMTSMQLQDFVFTLLEENNEIDIEDIYKYVLEIGVNDGTKEWVKFRHAEKQASSNNQINQNILNGPNSDTKSVDTGLSEIFSDDFIVYI